MEVTKGIRVDWWNRAWEFYLQLSTGAIISLTNSGSNLGGDPVPKPIYPWSNTGCTMRYAVWKNKPCEGRKLCILSASEIAEIVREWPIPDNIDTTPGTYDIDNMYDPSILTLHPMPTVDSAGNPISMLLG